MNNRIKHNDYAIHPDGRGVVVLGIKHDKGIALVRFLGTNDTERLPVENLHGPVGFCGLCKQAEYHTRTCGNVNPTALAMLGQEALVIKR